MTKTRASLGSLYLRHLGANLFGVVSVSLMNFFTPLDSLANARELLFVTGTLGVLAPARGLILGLAAFLQHRIQRPIAGALARLNAGMELDEALRLRAGRRALNLPILLAAVDLALWLILPLAYMLISPTYGGVPRSNVFFLYFRTAMIGLIGAAICFFLVESYCRERLNPVFFPEGRLARVAGAMRISIRRRIRVLYSAGTLVPMIILVGTLIFSLWDTRNQDPLVQEFGWQLAVFALVVCAIFIVISLRLNLLVERSIRNPVGEILRVTRQVGEGDFSQRVRVLSNDETGTLGDAANEMIAGLAERERIREIFGKFVTPEIRDEILSGRVPLHGQRTQATLLFSDIRGFTAYVEKTRPEEVIRSMREYFTAMKDAIEAHGGLVLQYVGDEIEAVFGVPLACEDHPDRAVRAALEMRSRLETLNETRGMKALPLFRHGIGIHTGEILAGTVGSEDRLSYALIGDAVNVASRIQGLTKEVGCDILASETTVVLLSRSFQFREGLTKSVPGRSQPVTVREILH